MISPTRRRESSLDCAKMRPSSEADMPFDFRKLGKYRTGMLRRIADLKTKSEDSLDVAMDTMMQDRVDSYFRIEQGFAEIEHSLQTIEAELPLVGDLSSAQRLEARL